MTGIPTEMASGSDSEGPWDLFPDGVLRLPSARQPASERITIMMPIPLHESTGR